MREKIEGLKGIELILAMAEGNPGALSVLATLARDDGPLATGAMIGILDKMNIRGSQIWVAYKDFAGGDMVKLMKAVADNDPELIAVINRECVSYGELAKLAVEDEGSAA